MARQAGRSALYWAVEAMEIRRLLAVIVPEITWIDPAHPEAVLAQDASDGGLVFGSAASPAADAAPAALPGLPALNSLPGAPVAIYIDFNGDAAGMSAYDEDGDPTTFNAVEQQHITECWRQVSVYYSMFNINVTTIRPTVPMAWGMITPSVTGGYNIGKLPSSSPQSFNPSGDARTRESGVAHEFGHNMGLPHQSEYDLLGNKTAEYGSGYDLTHGPIMGVDYARNIHKWWIGHPSQSPSDIQDDVAIIAASIRTNGGAAAGDGFRADDYSGSIGSATALTLSGAAQSISGIIERMTDIDVFSFTSDGSALNIDVNPTSPSGLAPRFEVRAADGTLLAAKDDTVSRAGGNNDEQLTLSLSAGTYYVLVYSDGNYGDLGSYTVTARDLPAGWDTQDIGTQALSGYAGWDPGTGAFTVAGVGSDIVGTSDQFRFAYQTLSGDGSIIAHITHVDNTSSAAKLGLDIRESLTTGSRHVGVVATYSESIQTISRSSTNGNSSFSGIGSAAFTPVWLKLTRSGNTFTTYKSADGNTWTQLAQVTVVMGTNVYIGLMCTSKNTSAINVGTLDSVSTTGNVGTPPVYNGLDSPTGLAVAPGSGTGLALTWNDVDGNSGYVIERSGDGVNFVQAGTTATGVTTYDDNGLWGSARYFYRISALGAGGKSAPSAPVSALNRPNAPFNVTITSWQPDKLIINWRDVSGETGYRVERSTDGVHFTTVKSGLGANVPSWTDTGLSGSTTYYYRVIATSALGDSPASAIATGSTRLAITPGLAFTSIGSNQMVIHWSAVSGATGYRIDRSTDGTTFTVVGTTAAGVLTYTDSTVTPLKEYYYRVVGTNSLTESVWPTPIFAGSPSAASLPSPWQTQDIGSNLVGTGAAGFSGSTLTVISTTGDIWSGGDQMRFVYQPLIGDGQIVARMASEENNDSWSKVGIMIRETLAAGSKNVFLAITPGNGVYMQDRTSTNGGSGSIGTAAGVTAPYYLKLVRSGNTIAGYISSNNSTWTLVNSVPISMSSSVYIGFAATSHNSSNLNTTTFDNIVVSNNAPTVSTVAAAAPSPVTSSTTGLSVTGADDHGESNLTYTWAATTVPPLAAPPVFSINGTNAAKSTIATFSMAGTYGFMVTIVDSGGLSTTSGVSVTVNQTLTSISVSPLTPQIPAGTPQPFSATAMDQFGSAFSVPPAFSWSVTGADNTIGADGTLTAGYALGDFTVSAKSAGITGTATASIIPVSITIDGTSDADHIYVSKDAGGTVQWWINHNPALQPVPDGQAPFAAINAFTINEVGGTNTITVDLTDGNPFPQGLTLNGGSANNSLLFKGLGGEQTFTASPLNIGGATITYSNVQKLGFGDGSVQIDSFPTLPSGAPMGLMAAGTATLHLTNSLEVGSLDITDTAIVNILAHGSRCIQIGTPAFPAAAGGVNIDPGGVLDLADNALIVQTADPAARQGMLSKVTGLIMQARDRNVAGELWQGKGITTSAASPDESGVMGLGVIANAAFDPVQQLEVPLYPGQWLGQAVDVNSILVKYTLNGDVDLNGAISSNDFKQINAGLLSGGAKTGYAWGDFNFDGAINFNDYRLANTAFLAQATAPAGNFAPSQPEAHRDAEASASILADSASPDGAMPNEVGAGVLVVADVIAAAPPSPSDAETAVAPSDGVCNSMAMMDAASVTRLGWRATPRRPRQSAANGQWSVVGPVVHPSVVARPAALGPQLTSGPMTQQLTTDNGPWTRGVSQSPAAPSPFSTVPLTPSAAGKLANKVHRPKPARHAHKT